MEPVKSDEPPSARFHPLPRAFVPRVLLLSLLVLAALAVVHRELLFVHPWHEDGDYAVDALHIARAGHFQAIHGNYSRFGFYHPGPAFYYVYALGEGLFYRCLHLVPSRYNADVLSGLVLQCFFFGAALVVVDQWIRRPLFVPLALVAFTIHLNLAGDAFISTWPPNVLLMPFLCFVVGAASLAGGRLQHLPLTVLAGCFLVHGHVAQPLYVVPLFLLAYGLAWRQARQQPGNGRHLFQEHRAAHLVSAGCIALFLLPMAIDLLAGARSNLAQIVEFENYRAPGKPLWRALLYFCGFFGYVKKPEAFLSALGPDRATAIGEHMAGYFIWAAIIVVVLLRTRQLWLRHAAAERPFVLGLTAFTFLAFLLSLYWGVKQIGPMYAYNGYFFYAILGCLLLLLCAAVSRLAVPKPALVGSLLSILAALLAWPRPHAPLRIGYASNEIPPAVQQALLSDPLPAAPKYLLFFNHDDWSNAVSIGLALRRAHHEFRADSYWGPKFTPDGGFEPTPPDFNLQGLSTWRLARRGPRDAGHPIHDNLRVYFRPLPLEPTSAVIDCGDKGNLELYALFGFAAPFQSAVWTISPYAGLVFDAPPVSSDVSVTFFAEPFAVAGKVASQPMTLSVNGRQVFTGVLTAQGFITARVPAEVWNAKRPTTMVLDLPAAASPRDLRLSFDHRKFGWHIERIVFESVR